MTMMMFVGIGTDIDDTAYQARAEALIARDDIAVLPNILVRADRHRAVWEGEAGGLMTVAVLQQLIDAFDAGDGASAIAAVRVCPPWLAENARAMLAAAFFADDPAPDAASLDDAALLTLAALAGAAGHTGDVAPLLDQAGAGRDAHHFGGPAASIAALYGGQSPNPDAPFACKLVIWDLDDTLWAGTLADGDTPVLHPGRVAAVRALNAHGIVSAICSKNEHAAARTVLEGAGLWDAFVFPRIAFVPKGAVVARMIADMRLRAQNVLFIDDNPHNLHEVAAAAPGIRTIDARTPECDILLAEILADNAHVAKSRVAEYRLLETKVSERAESSLTDAAFLHQSGIEATFVERMEALEFAPRMEELVNRSNQLNYTGSRAAAGSIAARLQDIDNYKVLAAFVWDRYGYYGLVGVAVYNFRTRVTEHFALSCRVMHMGVEAAMLARLEALGFTLDASAFVKPLPAQSAEAITLLPFHDAAVRERVLAQEAPRDWSAIRLRIMADCQSAAFHHYSRHRTVADFDNAPRLFNLPMMASGEADAQVLPPFLVYAAATDYTDFRWHQFGSRIDVELYRDCFHRFVERVVRDDHRLLVLLPPEDRPVTDYHLFAGCDPERAQALHPVLNALWRAAARQHPDRITLIELGHVLSDDELVHAHHYVPSALQRIAGMMDDWFDRVN